MFKNLIVPFVVVLFITFNNLGALAEESKPLQEKECDVPSLSQWSDIERWTWNSICTGRIADFNEKFGNYLEPKSAEGWSTERYLPSQFVETIILSEPFRSILEPIGIKISGAWFKEPLNLHSRKSNINVSIEDSRFDSKVDFSSFVGKTIFLSFDNSAFLSSVDFSKSLFLQVDIKNAFISKALNMGEIQIGASMSLNKIEVAEKVTISSSTIGNNLVLIGAKITGLLNLDGTDIGGLLLARGGAFFEGGVRLRGAKIGDQIDMSNSRFGAPLEPSSMIVYDPVGLVDMDSIIVEGLVLLRGSEINGLLSMVFARVGNSVDLRGSRLSHVTLASTNIGGDLRIGHPGYNAIWNPLATFTLRNTTVNAIQDTEKAWPKIIELEGFKYKNWGGLDENATGTTLSDRSVEFLDDWLKRDSSFSVRPYWQLASMLQEMGEFQKANDILYIGRERVRKRLTGQDWVLQTFLNYTIGYGYGFRYFYSLVWVLLFVILGVFMLRTSSQRIISDSKLGVFYSLDMLLPIVKLKEKHYKIDLEGSVSYYFYFHKMAGYVLASFLVSGLSGLTK